MAASANISINNSSDSNESEAVAGVVATHLISFKSISETDKQLISISININTIIKLAATSSSQYRVCVAGILIEKQSKAELNFKVLHSSLEFSKLISVLFAFTHTLAEHVLFFFSF